MNGKIYRHEDKYIISKAEYVYLSQLLPVVMKQDAYVRGNGYRIRSLYFDTIDCNDYLEHLIGVSNRKKIRLRIYDLNDVAVKLEIKNKEDTYTVKETAEINREEAVKLLSGNLDFLISKNNTTMHKVWMYMKMDRYYPQFLVDYNRKAYIYQVGDVRITFDTHIMVSKDCNLFNEKSELISVLQDGMVLMEVKYNKNLPYEISNMLASAMITQQISFSKYCMGQERLIW
jgi:hypothetical protein